MVLFLNRGNRSHGSVRKNGCPQLARSRWAGPRPSPCGWRSRRWLLQHGGDFLSGRTISLGRIPPRSQSHRCGPRSVSVLVPWLFVPGAPLDDGNTRIGVESIEVPPLSRRRPSNLLKVLTPRFRLALYALGYSTLGPFLALTKALRPEDKSPALCRMHPVGVAEWRELADKRFHRMNGAGVVEEEYTCLVPTCQTQGC